MGTILLDETRAFLVACVLGAALGLLWDLLRGARIAFRLKRHGVAVLDGLFCLVGMVELVVFLLQCTNGALRVYIAAGCALGFLFWRLTVSQRITRVFTAFWRAVSRTFRAAGRGTVRVFTPPRGN